MSSTAVNSGLVRTKLDVMTEALGDVDWVVRTWTPEHPNLYDVEFRLIKDGETFDAVGSYFAAPGFVEGRPDDDAGMVVVLPQDLHPLGGERRASDGGHMPQRLQDGPGGRLRILWTARHHQRVRRHPAIRIMQEFLLNIPQKRQEKNMAQMLFARKPGNKTIHS